MGVPTSNWACPFQPRITLRRLPVIDWARSQLPPFERPRLARPRQKASWSRDHEARWKCCRRGEYRRRGSGGPRTVLAARRARCRGHFAVFDPACVPARRWRPYAAALQNWGVESMGPRRNRTMDRGRVPVVQGGKMNHGQTLIYIGAPKKHCFVGWDLGGAE